VHGCEGDVGRVDRKIDAEWEVRRRDLGFHWAPSDVSGIPVTKRNRRFALPCPFRSFCVPLRQCVRNQKEMRGAE
jgi:hypothetical protein